MSCSIGLHKLVKDILDDKPWFSYKEDGDFGLISIFDSPAKKINKETSVGVANRVTDAINNAINDGYKIIGQVAYSGYDATGRGMVRVNPTENQLNLINAADDAKEIYELQKQVEEEIKLKEQESKPKETPSQEIQENKEYFENDEPFTRSSSSTKQNSSQKEHLLKVIETIKYELPKEISDAIIVLQDVPQEILGRNDLYLSMKDTLEEKGITEPFLINWLGINLPSNLSRKQTINSITSEAQIEKMANDSYNKLLKLDSPVLKNKDVKESFDKWVKALEKYPIVFKDLMLKHAIKNLNPDRRSKFVLQLSDVALQQTYGIAVNKPNELNRIGKLYDSEVLKTVSDAVGHEPSASGNGYWIHIPRVVSGKLFGFDTYEDFKKEIEDLTKIIKETNEILNKPAIFDTQEPNLDREDADKYGFQNFKYVRVESSHGRKYSDPFPEFLGKNYQGYYIHGYNTDTRKGEPEAKIVPITKEQAKEFWEKETKRHPNNLASPYEVKDQQKIYNLKGNISRLENLEKDFKTVKPEDWGTTSAQHKVNVELLKKLSPSTWCTASGMASHYVENYDNYLLIVDGITVAGIEALPKENLENRRFKDKDGYEYTQKNGEFFRKQAYSSSPDKISKEWFEEAAEDNGANKRKVKEVTSRANNGTSSIDHYDDIYAFFEKHNLDTNNSSLQRAKNAKYLGKVDVQINEDEYEQEDEYYGEHWYNNEPDYEDMYDNQERQRGLVAQLTTVEDTLREYENNNLPVFYLFDILDENLRNNERIANKAIDYDSHNIVHIDNSLPFYDELATRAVSKSPYIFPYLSEEKKNLPGLREIFENFEIRRGQEILDDGLPFSKTNTNKIQGYYDTELDKVIVIASNTPLSEASKVGIHEVAHRGMLRMAKDLGGEKELFQVLKNAEKQLMEKLPELLKRTGHKSLKNLMLDYGFDKNTEEGKFKLLQELAARWAEMLIDKPKPTWWKEFLTSIQTWITKFTGQTLNENEVNELVGGFVKYGTKPSNNNTTNNINQQGVLFSLSNTEVKKILNTPIEIEQEVTPTEDNTVKDLVEIKESEVKKKLQEILDILGITIKEDAQLPKDILAKVDMVQKLISFSKGELTEDNLTEEVIHLIVNIIEQKDPSLYNKMISEIWKFNIYKEVLDTYRTDPEYQTKEGKPDMAKLKKEAVVKLLVAKLVDNTNINDTKNIFGALWDKVSKFITDLFAQIPSYQRDIFEDFANDIVTKDNLLSSEDANQLKDGVFYSKRMNKAGMFANILNKTKNLFGKEKVKDAYITVPTIENPEEIFNILKALDKETSLVEAKEINPKTGKEEDVTYYVTGTGNKKRVSTILQEVKTNIGNYKNIDETELSAFIKNEKMMQGTKIHSTIEEIVSRYVDLETGFLRITPLPKPENIDIPEKYYTILENHLKDRFISYPKGTRFMVELKVVNEVYGYAGTIDFLAILPTGQIDILDWKSMDLTSKIAGKTIKKEEVHALTKEVHKQQLALYKQALMSVGIRDFRQTRTIPIIVENSIKKINKDKSFEDPKNLTITLSSLEIGVVDTTKETINYLLPISTSNEKVFDDVSNKPIPFLNDLIDKLEAYKKHSLEQRNQATTLDRDRLLDQIQRTDKTIQELRSKKTTKLLVTIFEDELFNIDKLSEKRFSFLEDNKDLTDLTPEQQNELREYFNKMNENYEFLNSFMKIMPNLENLKKIQNEISPELAESISKVRLKIIKSEEQASNAVSHNMNLMGKLLGMDDNVANIDVKTGTLTTIFSLYSRPELSLQMFTRLQKTINYLRDKEVQTFDTKMSNLMQGITSWVKKTGNNIEQVYSKIYDKENKRLFYKFKKEYATTLYEKREEVFQKYREIVNSIPFQLSSTEKTKQIQKEYRAYITPFLNENYDITKYVKLYEEAYKEYKKVVDEYIFDADPFENEAIREQKLDDWEYKHNIFTNPKALMTSGYNRNELLFKTINEDKWLSDEYRELTKPENKELFDFYQQLSSILEDANNEGLIDSLNNLPEVKNDSFQMFKYLKAGLFKNYLLSKYYAFYDKFLTNTYRNSDRTDPFTNKAKRKIPRKYSNSFFLKRKKDESPEEYQKRYNEEKKLHDMTLSTDLFYIFSVFGHHLIEYKLMKEYESRFQLLSLVENQKSNLIDISNTTGEVQYSVDDSGMEYRAKDSKPNTTQDDNKTNRDLLRHIDNYLYSDKLAPEGAIKNIMDWLYNLTTQVNLGFTYTAPLTNLMAGLVNSSLNNNTYYNSKDFKNNIIPAIKDKNSPINTKTFEKLNNLFNPFVEMTDQVYSTNKYKSTDKKLVNFSKAALFLYSAGDHIIQNKIVASIYYGTTIDENNNIISVEDYINNKYPDRYSLSPKERLVLAKKIDKEIKEYKKTNSLYSLMTANKVNLNAQNTILLTSIIEDTISKTLGNYNQQDINTFQTQWIAKFVYQHKKWLGETIATRFEEFAVNNNTKQLEWGRYRLMADFLFSATQKALKKMLFYNMSSILPDMVVKNTTLNNTISVEDIAKERYKVMQVEYKKKTNKDLPTTENEFIRFYVRQHENTEKELKTLLTLLLLSKFLLPLLAGGGDDDDENKEKDIYGTALDVLITVTSRSLREQSFTINPEQLKIMLLQGPIPVIGTAWNILDAGIITPTKEIYFGLKGDTKALKTNRVIDKGLNATPLKNINKLGKQISPDYRKFLNARRPKIQ